MLLCKQQAFLHKESVKLGKTIFLTFDDGPNELYTPYVLALLKRFEIKATFFVIGNALLKHRHLGKQIIDEGHLLANHTFSHIFIPSLKKNKFVSELLLCQNAINEFQDCRLRLFRPPSGYIGIRNLLFLKYNKYVPCLWTHDSCDSLNTTPEQITEKLISNVQHDSVILFHDDSDLCIKALETLIPYWKSKGYIFKSMSQFGL